MSLRFRLIVAFFVLSVVPLGAVTVYTYFSNVSAVREAAAREADLLTGELTQRMQLVTAQLSERVEHLMDLPQAQVTVVANPPVAKPAPASARSTKAATSAAATSTSATSTSAVPAAADAKAMAATAAATAMDSKVAQALGEAAMLLNNVELRGLRGGNPGGPGGSRARDGQRPPDDVFQGRGRGGRPGTPGTTSFTRSAGTSTSTSVGATSGGTAATNGATNANAATSAANGATGANSATAANGTTGANGATAGTGGTGAPGVTRGVPPAFGSTGQTSGTPRLSPEPNPQSRYRQGGRGAMPATPTAPQSPTAALPSTSVPPPGAPPVPPLVPGAPGVSTSIDASDPSPIMIDMAPIWRDVLHQIVPDGKMDSLTPDERQRVAREVNQRLLGIRQGIQLGAAGLQKKAEDIQREADAQSKTAKAESQAASARADRAATKSGGRPADKPASPTDTPPPATPATPAPVNETTTPSSSDASMRKVTALSGNHLNVKMEKNGEVVQQVNAEINMPNVLATVFSTTRRDRGEVPFAVGKDGRLYTPSDDDRQKVEELGLAAPAASDAPSTYVKGDWIIVTAVDPTGSGLRFGIARPVGDSMNDLRRTAARNAGFGLGFIAVALIGIVPLSGRLTRNLSVLTEGVDRIAHGDYRARVPVRSTDEIGQLATAFNQMAADVETHQRAAVEQERIKRELELGRQIQHEMLPQASMRLGLLEIRGVSVPAREVGGDFFNYFEVPGGQVAMLVGDVSGKGVGAALLMANIQGSLRTRLALGQDLSAITDAIDVDIAANTPGAVYATLFVGLFDPVTRLLQYVNAGHHPQYVLRPGGGLDRMASTGLPVGLVAGRGYEAKRITLNAGDLVFFYTDGCVEAESESGDMFGAERLESMLATIAATSADQVLERVESELKKFRGTREPFDDETMMAVRVG